MQRHLTPEVVAAELGLDERFAPWLAEIARPAGPYAAAPDVVRPDPADVARVLEAVGCSNEAVEDAVRTFPDPEGDAARWWLLQRSAVRLAATRGDVDAGVGPWPTLPEHLGVPGSCFPLHLAAVAVPGVRTWHQRHGVAPEVTRATLADLGRQQATYRRATGVTGVDALSWFQYHLRGLLVEVGGLQYRVYRLGGPDQPVPWYDPGAAETRVPGFRPGDLAVSLHLPEGAPINAPTVEESMAGARDLLRRLYPVDTPRILTGSSWMLDDQLRSLLPEDSRITRLARMFHLVPGWLEADAPVRKSVFHQWGQTAGPAPARTHLQQAVLDHLEGGGHFRWRTAWRELDPGGVPSYAPAAPAAARPAASA